MRYTKYKLFFAWDFEKEEKWINEMSAKGLELVHVGICKYVFEKNTSDRYKYRIELLENLPSHHESQSYIRFLEETGVEHIGSVFRWGYFRKNVNAGDFELYSDIESRIKHFKRVCFLFICLLPMNIINGINMLVRFIDSNSIFALVASALCFWVCGLLGLGLLKVSGRIRALKKNKYLME